MTGSANCQWIYSSFTLTSDQIMAKVCCAEGCKNSQRKPHLLHAKSHVRELRWHRLPKGKSAKTSKKRKQWVNLIKKGKKNFKPSDETFVCSNHFVDGEPTQSNPCPTLFLRSATSAERKPPTERQPLIEMKADMQLEFSFRLFPPRSIHRANHHP